MRKRRGMALLLLTALAWSLLDGSESVQIGVEPTPPADTASNDAFHASTRWRFPLGWWDLRLYPPLDAATPTLHFVWTSPSERGVWLLRLAVAAALHHHPRARLRLWSNALPLDFLDCFLAASPLASVERYDLMTLVQPYGQALRGFVENATLERNSIYGTHGVSWRWAHESDLVRILVLAREGGVYLDADLLLTAPIPPAILAAPFSIAQGPDSPIPAEFVAELSSAWSRFSSVNVAFFAANARFPHGLALLRSLLEHFLQWGYNPNEWGWPIALMTRGMLEAFNAHVNRTAAEEAHVEEEVTSGRVAASAQSFIEHMDARSVYPLHESISHLLATPERARLEAVWPTHMRGLSFAVHVSASNLWRVGGGYSAANVSHPLSFVGKVRKQVLPRACWEEG